MTEAAVQMCVIPGMRGPAVASLSLQLVSSRACFLEVLTKAVIRQLLHGGLHNLNWTIICCP